MRMVGMTLVALGCVALRVSHGRATSAARVRAVTQTRGGGSRAGRVAYASDPRHTGDRHQQAPSWPSRLSR